MAEEAELKVLVLKKEHLFKQIQKTFDLSKKSDTSSIASLKKKFHSVENTRLELSRIVERINILESATGATRPTGFTVLETVDEMYENICHTVATHSGPPAVPLDVQTSSQTTEAHVKLQRLDIPTFSGEISEWPMFFNLFKTNIHERQDIPKAHKLQHLLTKLSNRAQLICSGIPPTEENYEILWNTLVKRFEDKRNLASHYLDIIFNFKPQKVESSHHLNLFVDRVGTAVAALKALQIPALADFILFYLAVMKIDDQSKRLFENTLTDQEIPSFDKLIEFTQQQSKILSRINDKGVISSNQPCSSSNNNRTFSKPSVSKKSFHTFLLKAHCCALCKEEHPLFRCDQFKGLSPSERYLVVKQNNLCVNCLSSGHKVSDCSSKHFCNKCKLKHHTFLHFNKSDTSDKPCDQTKASSSGTDNVMSCCSQTICNPPINIGCSNNTTVLLSTVKISIIDKNGVPHLFRFLLDNGSMCNIITKSALEELNLPLQPSNTSLKGLGSTQSHVYGEARFSFCSRFENRVQYTVQALVVDKIADKLPVQPIDCSNLQYISGLSLADDDFSAPNQVSGILGSSVYPYILLGDSVSGKSNQPVAVNTKLGYVVMGIAPTQQPGLNSNSKNSSICMFQSSLDKNLVKFWELENIPSVENLKLSPDDKACEEIYSSEVSRDNNGIYQVPLPFKEDPSQLGDSFSIAKKRFLMLEKKLVGSENLRLGYNKAMLELIEKGFMKECSDQSDVSGYFIPHHMVLKSESVSTKLRIVFDASCKTSSGQSLNDLLHCGAKLYSNLFCVLLNFRLFPHALNGDITKMFLQIKVHEKYWKYQKLVWRFSPNDPLVFYNLLVVTFGMKSSPFLALRTVHQIISDEADKFPSISNQVTDVLYMDDLVATFLTEDECVQFYKEITALFKLGGFTFTKWSSNSSQVLQNIPVSDQLEQMISWDKDNFMVKVLGMCWNPKADTFSFKINQQSGSCTKRGILSYILTIYDPLGLLSPVVLFVKLLIKKLWICKIDWDAQPPLDIVASWNLFTQQLHLLENLHFPRHINVVSNCKFQLIGFSDSSEKAYGGMIFGRVVLPDGMVKIELVCAKSKVAPLKVESIPRLELCGLLLLSELMKVVTESYSSKFEIESSYCFTDSSVTLCWAHSSPHLFKVFVANRVSKIQQNINVNNLFHIAGVDNPADSLSRGLLPEQLVSSELYLSGPPWLYKSPDEWPIRSYSDFTDQEVPESKSNLALVSVSSKDPNSLLDMFHRCSSWAKLLNVVVFVLQFVKLVPKTLVVSTEVLNKAEQVVIKILQKEFFYEDITNIGKNLPCSPQIRKLCPFLDDNGILRVGGRIGNSALPYSQQHPILLPSKHHAVVLIVDYFHQKNFHTGPHLLSALLRQRFWILGARNLVRKRFQACNICFRLSPKCSYPKMADLPRSRVLESKPFLNTACDFLGPIHFVLTHRRGQRSQKGYICLFICLATKAIHLEVASDLSTPCFLNAFKRFLSRRGPVQTMLSDNGTNFVGAKNKLDEIYSLLESPEYKDSFVRELADHRIVWTMNPPTSPHFGGIFESNIKSFKTHFHRVVGKQLLSYEELVTLTTQIECLLNSRPLCKLNSDPEDNDILTPNHFLKLTNLTCIPALDVTEVNIGRLSRFQLIDQLVQSFWKRWSTEYLSQLQVREKWHTSSNNIKLGTVVLIRQESAAPLNWPTGVVSELYPGKDGIVRVVLVKTSKGKFKRAVHNVCPLPTQ